jgi:hypothetical protein
VCVYRSYQTAVKTDFFEDKTGLFSLNDQNHKLEAWCTAKIMREMPTVRLTCAVATPALYSTLQRE